jgi:hypothetical protein
MFTVGGVLSVARRHHRTLLSAHDPDLIHCGMSALSCTVGVVLAGRGRRRSKVMSDAFASSGAGSWFGEHALSPGVWGG